MNKSILLIALFFSILLTACETTSTTNDSSNNKDTTEEINKHEAIPLVQDEQTTNQADSSKESGSFEIHVLKSDIASPRKEMKGQLFDMPITVNYGSPSVKKRTIWGDLVPYEKGWRTGANEATTIEIPKDVTVEGQQLAAGKYGLFTIPTPEKWTIIFNETFDQWGAFEYDDGKDVLRVQVVPKIISKNKEMMDFNIDNNKLVLIWEKLYVPISIVPQTH